MQTRGTDTELATKDSMKTTVINNAFRVDIKNLKQEALKSMEQLRQSVKMKKRANPLEKIRSKLINIDTPPINNKSINIASTSPETNQDKPRP
jgi:hypothetical protein